MDSVEVAGVDSVVDTDLDFEAGPLQMVAAMERQIVAVMASVVVRYCCLVQPKKNI